MRRISHICGEQARRAGRAAREHAHQLRHELRHRRPHRLRHRLVILGGTLMVVVGLWFFVQGRAAHILQREFGRAMGAGWTLNVGRMGMNPLRGSYSAHDIYIRYGSLPDARQGGRSKPPRVPHAARKPLDLSLDGVSVEGLSVKDKSLTISRLLLIKPLVRRGDSLRVHVGWAAINRDSIVGVDFARGRLSIVRVSHLNYDSSVRMSLDNLLLDTAAHVVSVARAAIEPTYPKAEFAQKSWSHADWTQVVLRDILVKGIDFGQLPGARGGVSAGAANEPRQPLNIDSVSIGSGSIASFKERNVARQEHEKPMYHTLLQRVAPYVAVRNLTFKNFSAVYEELPVRGLEAGRVEFGAISGEARLLSPESISGDFAEGYITDEEGNEFRAHYFWQLTALVQGAATLTASGQLPLLDDTFAMKGTLGHCDAAIFNSMALPLGGIKIVGGALGGLHFALKGDSAKALAHVSMAYQGLEVAVFSRRNRERRLLTAIANDIMLERTIPWREAVAEQTRDPLRSPWNYIWHSLFAAAKEPIGIKPAS